MNKRVLVTGGRGLAGRTLFPAWEAAGKTRLDRVIDRMAGDIDSNLGWHLCLGNGLAGQALVEPR
jgi:hypothetical protein